MKINETDHSIFTVNKILSLFEEILKNKYI